MGKQISNIVFSKNRPLQLDAYIESLYRFFSSDLIQTYIVYKPELFEEEYEKLFCRFPDCVVIREEDFHADVLCVLDQVETKYILFGIDDVVYFDAVDFDVIDKTFTEHEQDIFGFSLRFSPESLSDGGDVITDLDVAGRQVYRINWKQGRTPNTRYPFELCATVYKTAAVKRIVGSTMNNNPLARRLFCPSSGPMRLMGKVASTRKILKKFGFFFDPNTLESWNCSWCLNHKNKLKDFIYFQKLCASAIQINMVNTSTKNDFVGTHEHTVEALNEEYRKGYALDIDFVATEKPTGTHCGLEHFRLRKL
ncbi:MAG: hypothetical protein ACYS8Z_05910 [Planctomycetota bacterium]|jgi:hypothetical protein